MKKIRIAGPPGTGKTTKLVEIYYSHLKEYSPADIVVISHTNTASDHIRERIKDSKSIQNYQKETGHEIFPKINNAKETLKHNVSTIHKFCKDRVEGQAFLIEDYENLVLRKPIFDKHTSGKKFSNVQALFGLHPFFKFISMARDNGKTVESYYRGLTAEEKEKDVKYYLEEELEPMADYYKKFKESLKINGRVDNILDFQDMIKKFYDTFKNYIMSKPEDLTITGRSMKQYSEKVKNVDLNINWERVDYLFSNGEGK